MTSILPSVLAPTSSDDTSPPAPTSTTSPPPPSSQPNQTTDPPPSNPSTPPPQSPPQAPPPSTPLSPPPALTTPPPSTPASPPPSPPTSPPPSLPTSPPSTPNVPPPSENSPPSPVLSPPPESSGSPPPQAAPVPPVATSPPPQVTLHSPPPPENDPTSPSSKSPPSPSTTPPPESSPSPPTRTPSPSSSKAPPPPATTSPSTPSLSPPPSVPSSSSPPTVSPPGIPSTPSITGSPSSLPSIPTEKPTAKPTNSTNGPAKSTNATGAAVAIGVVVGFIVLSLLVMAVWFVNKRKRKSAGPKIGYTMPSPFASSQNSDSAFLRPQSPHKLVGTGSTGGGFYSPSDGTGVNNSRSWFTYEELARATDGFSENNLLGEGGFGCVYKGIISDGREVAVKQLKIGSGQGEREFRAEVEIISRVHHRHLVSLVGYCISEHQRLLVYDFVQNDTLHYHLHGRGRPVMDWALRVKVAAGAARGIAYLHEDCHPRIIHRDIKSSNILLDSNFEAQVADFGLAKLALDTNTHVSTRVMGTFGYMAPEYATSGKLTEKSDVYSYGVVLLELITGRKPVDDSQPLGDESLVEWARPLLAEAIEHQDFDVLVDPRLEKNYVDHEMFRMIEAAAACVRHSAAKRPKMSQVVRALDSLDELSDLTNGMKPGQSEVFDSAQQSAQIRMFQRLAFGSQEYSSSFYNHSQSSWRSRDDGSQGSWKSRDYGNPSGGWSREQRDRNIP